MDDVYPNASVSKLEILSCLDRPAPGGPLIKKKQRYTYGLTENLVVNMLARLLIRLNE